MKFRKRPIYEIRQRTKAIITKDSAYSRALILDRHKERLVTYRPEEILRNSCLKYGASLEGRKEHVRDMLKINSNVPIPVDPSKGVYMIPTASAKRQDCVWISYYHIAYYEQRDDRTYIGFTDGTGLYVNTSVNKFDMQFKRTSQVIAGFHRSFIFGNKYINDDFTPNFIK